MAGDTLRGIGKRELAEALESTPDRTTEPQGSAPSQDAAADIDIEEARPVRSLDDLPSERTGQPASHYFQPEGRLADGIEPADAIEPGQPTSPTTVLTSPTLLGQPGEPGEPGDPVLQAPAAVTAGAASAGALPVVAEAPEPAAPVVVDDALPFPSAGPIPRSGPSRVSFGTMIGHEMHAVQARVADPTADAESGARGTAHGRGVHLLAHPGMAAVEPEPAAIAVVPATPTMVASPEPDLPHPAPREPVNEFSGGDHSFFEAPPLNDEYEPENPRGRLYTRLAVSGAVLAVVTVVVVAWVNSHGSAEEPPPVDFKTASVPPAPRPPAAAPPRNREPPPTSTIPSSIPEPVVGAGLPAPGAAGPAAVHIAKAQPAAPRHELEAPAVAPPPAPAAAHVAKTPPATVAAHDTKPAAAAPSASTSSPPAAPAAREGKTPAAQAAIPHEKKPAAVATTTPREPTRAPTPTPASAASPKVAVSSAARSPRPEAPARPVARPTPPSASRAAKAPAARGKAKYDPDGTLPLFD